MRPRRVGVLGSFHAGKTVLLTSLISQIKHGHLDVFGPDVVLAELNSTNSRFDPLETRSGLIPFDYDTAHDRLAHGGWPSKLLLRRSTAHTSCAETIAGGCTTSP